MSLKRKLEAAYDDAAAQQSHMKQLRLSIPFPSSEPDTDCMMSDAPMDVDGIHHTRLPSSASTVSSSGSSPSPLYPTFELYPSLPDPTGRSSPVGLMQPNQAGSTFTHHSENCTQIPKLRVACEAGPNGQRSMWALCENCGAVSMID